MSRSGPPLNALQAFVTACEARSLREAARRLGIGHSAVSRHIQALQEWAGCRLMETGPNGLILTEEGQHMLERAMPAFAAIRALRDDFNPSSDSRGLQIWCVPGLSARWLAPRLAALRTVMGERPIVVRPTEQMPNLSQGEADAAIRYGPLPEGMPELAGVELCRPLTFPVASPTWLQLNRVPDTAAQLPATTLLHEHSDEQWRRWLAAVGLPSPPPLSGPRLWYASMALDAAEHGQGIALANTVLVEQSLQARTLVCITSQAVPLDPYILLTDRRRWNDPLLARLRDWLTRELTRFNVAGVPREAA
jgi:DNA-binding transcriptional LysR family regulator